MLLFTLFPPSRCKEESEKEDEYIDSLAKLNYVILNIPLLYSLSIY